MSQWGALPQRTRRRRSAGAACSESAAFSNASPGNPTLMPSAPSTSSAVSPASPEADRPVAGTPPPATSASSSTIAPPADPGVEKLVLQKIPRPQRNPIQADGGSTETGAAGTGVRSGKAVGHCEAGDWGAAGAGEDQTTVARQAARNAAVATAVEERSKIERFSGGLEGGAGADGANFEYLDHTADVQLHSFFLCAVVRPGGDSIERAMESALAAMFNVITDIGKVDVDPSLTRELKVEGHDALSLLFALLDEFLFLFHAEGLAVKKATVGPLDREAWTVQATAEGETFDLRKHPQGTEVKAITYSNMQINEDSATGRTDIYVIVDI